VKTGKPCLLLILALFLIYDTSLAQSDSLFTTIKVKRGQTLYQLFGENWEFVSRINKIHPRALRVGMAIKIPKDWKLAKTYSPAPDSLFQIAHLKLFILVNLNDQYLAGYERGRQKFWYSISSGLNPRQTPHWYILSVKERDQKTIGRVYKDSLPDLSTPTGFFKVLGRDSTHASSLFKTTEGEGASMPWAVMFWIDPKGISYWLHGTDDNPHGLPGFPASHGCPRLFDKDAKSFYHWAKYKTLILIIQNDTELRPKLDSLPIESRRK